MILVGAGTPLVKPLQRLGHPLEAPWQLVGSQPLPQVGQQLGVANLAVHLHRDAPQFAVQPPGCPDMLPCLVARALTRVERTKPEVSYR